MSPSYGAFDVDKSVQTPRTPSWTGENLGLTVDQAQALAKQNRVEFRISRIGDEYFMLAWDDRVSRITAEIENGVIVDYVDEKELSAVSTPLTKPKFLAGNHPHHGKLRSG